MKIYRGMLCFMAAFLSAQVWAQNSVSTDLVEKDAIHYTNRKQVGRISPFVSLSSYEFKTNGDNSGMKPTQRFGLGATTTVLSGQAIVDVGLSYMPIGALYEGRDSSGMSVNERVDLEYVAVPILVKKFFKAENTGFYAKAALTPAYLFNVTSDVSAEQASEDNFKSFDIQGALGVGGLFATDFTSRVFIDLTWGRSLAPISKNSAVDVYNEGFLLTTGLSL